MTFKGLFLPLIAVLLTGAMGDGRNAPPPVALPEGAAVPGAGLNRPGTREVLPEAPATGPAATALRILPAAEADPAAFLWQVRVVVVFADTAADTSFIRQVEAFGIQPGALTLRDVVVVTDTDPAANSVWRQRLRPEGFSLVLIDKDGQVKARKPIPWTTREIARAIDKFPSRLEEIGRAGLGL